MSVTRPDVVTPKTGKREPRSRQRVSLRQVRRSAVMLGLLGIALMPVTGSTATGNVIGVLVVGALGIAAGAGLVEAGRRGETTWPSPRRPVSLRTWRVTYLGAIAGSILTVQMWFLLGGTVAGGDIRRRPHSLPYTRVSPVPSDALETA